MNTLVDEQGCYGEAYDAYRLVPATGGKLLKQHDVKTYFTIQTKS